MPGYGIEMRAYRPPEAGMPCWIALTWAVVDLQLAFWFRATQLALEMPLEWCNACGYRCVVESGEESHD